MDVPILLANLPLLERLRPVLFFEYDPHLGAEPHVFERLREIGYATADWYENTGEHVATVELPDAPPRRLRRARRRAVRRRLRQAAVAFRRAPRTRTPRNRRGRSCCGLADAGHG